MPAPDQPVPAGACAAVAADDRNGADLCDCGHSRDAHQGGRDEDCIDCSCARFVLVPSDADVPVCRRCRLPRSVSNEHERGCTWHPRNRLPLVVSPEAPRG